MRPWINQERHHCYVVMPKDEVGNSAPPRHYWNVDQVDIQELAKQGDVYYGVSSFRDKSRMANRAHSSRAFWLDVDYKDFESPKEALGSTERFLRLSKLPDPNWIVSSGNGMHLYWIMDKPLLREDWYPLAKGLKKLCRDLNFRADPSRTGDIASILRVPGTMNRKDPSNPKPVTIIRDTEDIPQEVMVKALPKGAAHQMSEGDGGIERPFNRRFETYSPSDLSLILKNCAQMRGVRKDLEDDTIREPYWRAGLSVLYRCIDGDELIQEWSSLSARYMGAEYTAKKARLTKGPFSCDEFKDQQPNRCRGCPFYGSIQGPIILGQGVQREGEPQGEIVEEVTITPDRDLETKEDPKASMWERILPADALHPWFVTKSGGISVTVEQKDGSTEDQPISRVKIWLTEAREKAREEGDRNRASYMVRWVTPTGEIYSAPILGRELYDTKELVRWTADENLRPLIFNVPAFQSYLSMYAGALLKAKRIRIYHDKLGWCRDKFVVGDVAVSANGVERALINSSSTIARLGAPSPHLDKWIDIIKGLNAPGLEVQAFTMMAGFGSALLALKQWTSAVVSLAGPTGAGKTLAIQLAMSIYGNPRMLSQSSQATVNSIEGQLSAQNHVPYLLDEVTKLSPWRLANFIYTATNGEGKASLTQQREFRETGSWNLTPFVTTNRPILDMTDNEIEEAHRRRLLEIYIHDPMGDGIGRTLAQAQLKYYGAPAVKYLTYVAQHRAEIAKRLEATEIELEQVVQTASSDRFIVWTLASSKVGGEIARDLGLISFDLDTAMAPALAAFKENTDLIEDPTTACIHKIAEFLEEYYPHIIKWPHGQVSYSGEERVLKPLIRNLDDGTIAIRGKSLRDYMVERRVPHKVLTETLGVVSVNGKADTIPMRLGEKGGLTRVYHVSMDKLGLGDAFNNPTNRNAAGLRMVE